MRCAAKRRFAPTHTQASCDPRVLVADLWDADTVAAGAKGGLIFSNDPLPELVPTHIRYFEIKIEELLPNADPPRLGMCRQKPTPDLQLGAQGTDSFAIAFLDNPARPADDFAHLIMGNAPSEVSFTQFPTRWQKGNVIGVGMDSRKGETSLTSAPAALTRFALTRRAEHIFWTLDGERQAEHTFKQSGTEGASVTVSGHSPHRRAPADWFAAVQISPGTRVRFFFGPEFRCTPPHFRAEEHQKSTRVRLRVLVRMRVAPPPAG